MWSMDMLDRQIVRMVSEQIMLTCPEHTDVLVITRMIKMCDSCSEGINYSS